MSLKFIPIDNPGEIHNSSIRDRALQSKRSFSIQYIALFDRQEAGFLSFDNKSHVGIGVVYEIYILSEYRRKGIGTKLLELGEELARKYKCKKIVVCPVPFDGTITEDILVLWYRKHGYNWSTDETGEMEKKC